MEEKKRIEEKSLMLKVKENTFRQIKKKEKHKQMPAGNNTIYVISYGDIYRRHKSRK